MIIDFRGETVRGVSITLSEYSKLYNGTLIDCDIDDTDYDREKYGPFMVNCKYVNCKIKSQCEAAQKIDNGY